MAIASVRDSSGRVPIVAPSVAGKPLMSKYLKYFPKPLLDDLVSGRWLPIVGAGMSLNAILPSPATMPLWADLGKKFADELQDYTPTGALDAISAYEHEFGRTRLIERLAEVLHINLALPGRAHREFCHLPFDIVCTTNFDFLLEKQYDSDRQDNRAVHPVVDEDQLSINMGVGETLLLKLHGDLRHPKRLVVTETDYDGFLSNYPLIATYLANQLITKTAVVIGYSLEDPDFRQIWQVVGDRLGKMRRTAYAILVNVRPGDVARFERRGVKVVNLPGDRDKYGDVLADAFAELREYRRENAGTTIKPTEEKPLEQFMLPRGAVSRLCYFSVPYDVLPFYREYIFPLAEANGFVPVTGVEVVNLGDSISAMLDTLIDRSSVVIVDATSSSTQYELGIAASRAREKSMQPNSQPFVLIPVVTDSTQLAGLSGNYTYMKRSQILSEDSSFVNEIAQVLHSIAGDMGVNLIKEPRRLFEAKEYRASIISAMTLLEATLRQSLHRPAREAVQRPVSLRQLVQLAQKEGVLRAISDEIYGWMKVRNEAVHLAKQISRQEAKVVIDGVERIIAEINDKI